MSKKDYKAFAEAFSECKTVEDCILKAAKIFKVDNPLFRPIQFFEACGFDLNKAGLFASYL